VLSFSSGFPDAVAPWGLRETALKSTNETGGMFVAHQIRNLLHAHAAVLKQLRGLEQPLFGEQMPKPDAGVLLEQVLEMGMAEAEFFRQIMNCACRLGFNQLDNPANAIFLRGRKSGQQHGSRRGRFSIRAISIGAMRVVAIGSVQGVRNAIG
jgi:hypothetical protein